MNTIPMRLFGLAVALLSFGGIYYNWHIALNEQRYMLKLAFIAPMGLLAGLFVMIFPHLSGKPEGGKMKLGVWIGFAVCAAAGALNWYLLSGGF